MTATPFRTSKAELTCDQLLLADLLATIGPVPLGALRQDDYGFHMNVTYSHGIAEPDLLSEVGRMVDEGWIVCRPADDDEGEGEVYALTRRGGELWETERLPVWELYCSCVIPSTGETLCGVVAYNREIGECFIRTANSVDCWFHLLPGHRTPWELDDAAGVRYWRASDAVWVAVFEVSPIDRVRCRDRLRQLEERRTWWHSLAELQRFVNCGDK